MLLWKRFNDKVVDNINNRLLEPFSSEITYGKAKELRDKNIIKNIFYFFVDNTESLKEKAKLVRLNGLIWTSFMDLSIISFFGSFVFFAKWLIGRNDYNSYVGIILLLLSILSYLMIILLTSKHLSLSNEQLDYITSIDVTSLREKILAQD